MYAVGCVTYILWYTYTRKTPVRCIHAHKQALCWLTISSGEWYVPTYSRSPALTHTHTHRHRNSQYDVRCDGTVFVMLTFTQRYWQTVYCTCAMLSWCSRRRCLRTCDVHHSAVPSNPYLPPPPTSIARPHHFGSDQSGPGARNKLLNSIVDSIFNISLCGGIFQYDYCIAHLFGPDHMHAGWWKRVLNIVPFLNRICIFLIFHSNYTNGSNLNSTLHRTKSFQHGSQLIASHSGTGPVTSA